MLILTAAIMAITAFRTKGQVLESVTALRRAANLSCFMPESLVERLSAEDLEQHRSSRRQDVAVMFTDICGFTTLPEQADPAQLDEFLSEFRRRMAAPIRAHDGTVDPALFGHITVWRRDRHGQTIRIVLRAPTQSGH